MQHGRTSAFIAMCGRQAEIDFPPLLHNRSFSMGGDRKWHPIEAVKRDVETCITECIVLGLFKKIEAEMC